MEHIKAISPYFVILPLLMALIKFRSLSVERKYLAAAILAGTIAEIGMRVTARIWHNNMPIVHVYTVLEFCLLLSVFYHWKKDFIPKRIYLGLLVGFIVLAIGNTIFNQGIMQGNSLVRSIEGIILIAISLYYFFDLLKRLDTPNPEKTFMFWVSIAILVYFGGNLLIFIYFNQLQNIGAQSEYARSLMLQIGMIGYILNIFLYTLYSIALLCKNSRPFPKSSR